MMHAATCAPFVPRSGPRVAILTLVLYVSFLIAAAPASVLAWALAYSTNGAMRLEGAAGSIWSGRAAAVLVERPGTSLRFEELAWEWDAASLAVGEVAMRLRVDNPYLRGAGTLAPRFDGVRVSNAVLRLPASYLAAYLPALGPGGLSGEVTVQSVGFTLGRDRYAGVGTVEWRDAAIALSSVRPLGDYRAIVTGTGAHADFRLETIQGVLRVEGRGAWSSRGGLGFEGTARSAPEFTTELAELLKRLGPGLGGEYRVQLAGLRWTAQ